jgi:hypothetical protein
LTSCKNGQDENVNNSVDANTSIQKTAAEVNLKKKAQVFTPSELFMPFPVQYKLGISPSFPVI